MPSHHSHSSSRWRNIRLPCRVRGDHRSPRKTSQPTFVSTGADSLVANRLVHVYGGLEGQAASFHNELAGALPPGRPEVGLRKSRIIMRMTFPLISELILDSFESNSFFMSISINPKASLLLFNEFHTRALSYSPQSHCRGRGQREGMGGTLKPWSIQPDFNEFTDLSQSGALNRRIALYFCPRDRSFASNRSPSSSVGGRVVLQSTVLQ